MFLVLKDWFSLLTGLRYTFLTNAYGKRDMCLEIIAAESLGVRGLCCLVTFQDRCIIIDSGVSLGYVRHGLLPHPLQIAEGCKVREKILHALNNVTDVVFSHFYGDHVPLLEANPYQLSIQSLPSRFHELRCWSKSDVGLSSKMSKHLHDLADLFGANMHIAEGLSEGPLSFSRAVPHGVLNSKTGTLMMTRIDMDEGIFVHASDIQLLDDSTVDQKLIGSQILCWLRVRLFILIGRARSNSTAPGAMHCVWRQILMW